MLNFEQLTLHNFGSYGHTEVDLRNRGFCLVTGQNNYKKDNAVSNGSGKSFLWNAACFALCGETINGLHSNLKNINISDDPSCWVSLTFTEHTDHYQVTRHVTPRSDLKIIKNGTDVSGKGIRESEKKLAELLPDLSKNLITSTILIGQGMPNKFSSFSPSGRKELLEKLTRADFMIEDIKQRVTNRQLVLNQQIREAEDSLLANRSQLNVYETNLKTKQAEAAGLTKPDFTTQIEQANALIAECAEELKDREALVNELEATYSQVSDQLFAINTAKIEALATEKTSYDAVSQQVFQRQATLVAERNALQAEVKRLEAVKDTCPTCGQHIPGAVKPDTTAQIQRLTAIATELESVESQLKKYQTAHLDYINQANAYYEGQMSQLKSRVEGIQKDLTARRKQVDDWRKTGQAATSKRDKLLYEQENWDKRQTALQLQISDLEAAIARLTATITITDKGREDLQEHLKVVKKMDTLIKRDFRGYLLANIIAYINKKSKEYSQIVFGTEDLEVILEGNDLNISYCGKMFDNLSGGEKQRVDLILQFAIRNMLTAHLNFNSNILVLDEITDFLDKKSCAAVLDLITKELNTIESVFIVSHHASELELPIDSELTIMKNETGISEIISGV